jgi:hypothetical protein
MEHTLSAIVFLVAGAMAWSYWLARVDGMPARRACLHALVWGAAFVIVAGLDYCWLML